MNNDFRHQIQAFLHYKFIHMGEYKVEDVSKEMDISASLLYKYISGERQFPVDQLEFFMKATDFDYLRRLAGRCGFNLVPIIKNKIVRDLMESIINIISCAIDLEDKRKREITLRNSK